jgi:sterol desaturase/sphingolipid hydroxylase (fatty acid hydroxylase superfamily)
MIVDLDTLIALKTIAVGTVLVGLFMAERLWPAAPRPDPAWGRVVRNGVLWLITAAFSVAVVVPITAWAAGQGWAWRPGWWSGWPGLVADIVLLDLLIYWWHRANHTVPLLWRFHAVHHRDRFLDTTSALRFHVGEVALSACVRAAVILALGFPLASILVFEAVLLAATLFHHSNLRLPPAFEAALARVVITPSLHWVHHHRRRVDTDSTYGTLFSVWDRLFGSTSPTRRTPTMAIGVEGVDEADAIGLLLAPFLPQSNIRSD